MMEMVSLGATPSQCGVGVEARSCHATTSLNHVGRGFSVERTKMESPPPRLQGTSVTPTSNASLGAQGISVLRALLAPLLRIEYIRPAKPSLLRWDVSCHTVSFWVPGSHL